MTIKPTPGPWTISASKDLAYKIDQFTSGDAKEDVENAKLIAAAPDILEALQELFKSYKELADSGDAGQWRLEDQAEGIKALAAIKKATE